MKIEKKVWECLECGQQITIIIDQEIIAIIEKEMEKPKPPPDLEYWIEQTP
jgi:hypothetical protein